MGNPVKNIFGFGGLALALFGLLLMITPFDPSPRDIISLVASVMVYIGILFVSASSHVQEKK